MLFAIIAIGIGAALWVCRYPALYYYYLWRLDHTKWVEDLHEDIESIAPHVIPFLVRTYEDVSAPKKRRHAAAFGLIKADRKMAENLFISFLDNEDDEIVRLAIFDLAIAESDQAFERVTELACHPSARIRWAVARYLGNFSEPNRSRRSR
jgi:HEAT repeat protein